MGLSNALYTGVSGLSAYSNAISVIGNNIANAGGELEVEYQPDALLNPPPGFWSYIYPRRTNSVQKVVLP